MPENDDAAKAAAEQKPNDDAAKAAAEQKAIDDAAKAAAEQKAIDDAAKAAAEQKAIDDAAKAAAEQKAIDDAAKAAAEQKAIDDAAKAAAEQKAIDDAAKAAAEQKAIDDAAKAAAEQKAIDDAAKAAAEQKANDDAAKAAAEQKAIDDAAKAAMGISGQQSADDQNPIIDVGDDSEVQIIGSNENNVTVLPPITKVGYKLSVFILCIIAAFLVALVLIISFKTFDASDKIAMSSASVPDSTFAQQKEIIKSLQEEKKNYRDFIMSISQMVLLNLLLPTLTAILGYIFGSREGSSSSAKRNDTVPVT
jgi:hypothetical protein